MSRFWAAGDESSDDDDDDDKSSNSDSNSDSSSNSSDNSSSDDDDDDDDNSNKDGGGGGLGQTGQQEANRWLAMSDDSSDEDSVRVVLSGKERFQEMIVSTITKIRKAMKARDYYEIQTLFDTLSKALIKNKQYLVNGVPRPLVRILCDLEDYATERLTDKEQFKTISARQGRALNRFKLTFKKHNRQYQTVMTAYRANPIVTDDEDDDMDDDDDDDDDDDEQKEKDNDDASDASSSSSSKSSSESSDDDDDDDDDDQVKTKTKSASPAKKKKSSDDSDGTDTDDDDEWASDDDSSSSDSEGDGAGDAYAQLKGRARWLKKNTVTAVKVVKNKEERARAREEARLAAQAAAASQEAMTAVKSVLPEEHLTAAMIQRRIQELAATRRGKDTIKQLRELEGIQRLSIQFGPRTEIPVIMYVIAAQFALQRTLDDCMDTITWKSCASYLERIAHVLLVEGYTLGVENVDASDMIIAKSSTLGNTKMKAALNASDGAMAAVAADETFINPITQEQETADERAERLRIEKETTMSEAERKVIPVVGSLSLYLTRLEEEYTKSLQRTSHHSDQYVIRLRDETKLVALLSSFQTYFERVRAVDSAAVMAQLRIEHLYYRHDSIAKQVDKAGIFYERYGEVQMLHPACIYDDTSTNVSNDFTQFHPGAICGKPKLVDEDDNKENELYDFTQIISDLSHYVYKYGSKKSQIRSMICQIYHHALHDRFTEARDLLLMSHLQDTIHDCGDVSTMILFNRMMVTVGMCAFRTGRIYDAHQCLSDICTGRVRELLAQGVNTNRFADKTPEQEKAEKRRLVPYHQHINLDLLEACHLISAMLLEVPNMAGAAVDVGGTDAGSYRRHRVISRTFRKYIENYHHQVFTGPPEQTRDFVMRAAKSLMKGDWKKCIDLIRSMDVWLLIPGDDATTRISNMLEEKVKEEGLRTFLFAFSAQYDSLSLGQLCGMFALSKNEVHSIVSKMMINRELLASWDQPTETIVLRKTDLSQLQILALQFSEKATALVEANERLLDAQRGSGYKEDYWKGDRNDDRGRGSGGRGGRGAANSGRDGGGGRGRGNNSGRGRGDNRNSGGRGRDGTGGRSGGRGGGGSRGRGRSNNSSGSRNNTGGNSRGRY